MECVIMSAKIKKVLCYYLILGFVLGFSIALLSIIYELWNNTLAFNIKNIIYIHTNNKLLFVIDSAPFFLSLFLGISYMIFIYTPANYEDKDLTKTFIKNNKDKLSHIYIL